jgi:DUF438 domain-containing protein
MLEKPILKLTYEEQQALVVIRKAMKRKPEIAAALLEGMAKDVATTVMLTIRDELQSMLKVNQAFSEVAHKLALMEKEKEDAQKQTEQAQTRADHTQTAQPGGGDPAEEPEAQRRNT